MLNHNAYLEQGSVPCAVIDTVATTRHPAWLVPTLLSTVQSWDFVLVSCRHAERCFGLRIGPEALFRCHGVCASSSQCGLYGSRGLSPSSFLEEPTNN